MELGISGERISDQIPPKFSQLSWVVFGSYYSKGGSQDLICLDGDTAETNSEQQGNSQDDLLK